MNHVYTAGEIWDGCGSGARRGVTGSAAEAVVGGGRRRRQARGFPGAQRLIPHKTARSIQCHRPGGTPRNNRQTEQDVFRTFHSPRAFRLLSQTKDIMISLTHTTGEIIQPARGRGTKPGGGGAGVRGAGGRGGGVSLGVRACPILRIATPTRKAW